MRWTLTGPGSRLIGFAPGTDLCKEGGQPLPLSPGLFAPVHKGLGVDKICIDQTGIEHPGKKGRGQSVPGCPVGRGGGRQSHLLLPAVIGRQILFLAASQKGGGIPRVSPAAAVRQTAVVSGNGERCRGVTAAECFLRPGGGVVHPGTALQPQLEFLAVLADVVEPAGKLCLLGGTETPGKAPCKGGGAGKMVVDGLGAGAVLADMGKCLCHGKYLL